MHHTVDHPRSGSVVRLARGDTLELLLRQRSARADWQLAMAPYGMDLLEDGARAGDRRPRSHPPADVPRDAQRRRHPPARARPPVRGRPEQLDRWSPSAPGSSA